MSKSLKRPVTFSFEKLVFFMRLSLGLIWKYLEVIKFTLVKSVLLKITISFFNNFLCNNLVFSFYHEKIQTIS